MPFALLFGGIHGLIRPTQQRGDRFIQVAGVQGQADAGPDANDEFVKDEGYLESAHDARGQLAADLRISAVAKHGDQLIAADAPQQVAFPEHSAQASAHRHQHPITDGMAIGVVHRLEVVQIDHADGQVFPLAVLRLPEDPLQFPVDSPPVPHAGEGISESFLLKLGVLLPQQPFPLPDLLLRTHHQSAQQRCGQRSQHQVLAGQQREHGIGAGRPGAQLQPAQRFQSRIDGGPAGGDRPAAAAAALLARGRGETRRLEQQGRFRLGPLAVEMHQYLAAGVGDHR